MTETKGHCIKGAVLGLALIFLLVAASVSAGGKVYTNKDLERYENRMPSPVTDINSNLKSSRVSVDFLDAEIYQVLRMIAEEAKAKDGVEIFISPEMSGRITVRMINAPWTQVLKEIEQKHNLVETFVGKRTMLIYQKK